MYKKGPSPKISDVNVYKNWGNAKFLKTSIATI
jgi:hypothetical protein